MRALKGKLLEVSVQAHGEGVKAVKELFNGYAEGGAVIEESWPTPEEKPPLEAEVRLIVKVFLPFDDRLDERRHALEVALRHLSQLYPLTPPRFRELREEDWARAWQDRCPVQHVGDRLVIKPSWRGYVPAEGEVVLQIDPGLAFGTGLHATTRLCLVELERLVASGMRVLDLGTGTGILAIAAAKLGAAPVLALDIDRTAVRVARENALANGVQEIVDIRQGDLANNSSEGGPELFPPDLSPPFDLIVINILAKVIIDLADRLPPLLTPEGLVVLSGIIEEQSPAVEAKMAEVGLVLHDRRREADWVALVGGR
ncbi:MAG: 50S ribosomal protein L11 methyltransferase, partial [Anaerolineae bacterium]